MYFHVYKVFLLAIFSTVVTAHAQVEKEFFELLENSPESGSRINQAISSKAKVLSLEDDPQYRRTPKIDFLIPNKGLAVLNTLVHDKGNAIDLLKSAASFSEGKNNIMDMANTESTEEPAKKYYENPSTTATTANVSYKTSHAVVNGNKSVAQVLPSYTDYAIFDVTAHTNDRAVAILKAAAESMVEDTNSTNNKKEQHEQNHVGSVVVSNANRTNVSTTSQMPSDDVLLSELINLSYNDDDHSSLGQKVDFQRSKMSPAVADANTAGMDILRTTSTVCGSLFGKRISFANATTLMEYPWTALLLYNTKIRYHCGGSLITGKYILTAAHCVAQEFYELVGVRLGEHDITTAVDCAEDLAGDTICAKTVDADIVKIIVHHAYSHLSFKNDIALLRLDKDYLSRSFYPICIPTPEIKLDGHTAIVAGWGATEKAVRSEILLKADVPIYDMSRCRAIYRYSVFNDSTEICGSGANEVDVCKGDSGGALFNYHNVGGRDKYYQFGIISLGVRRCGDSRFLPAVFTNVNGFYKWIENNLEY